ncbi:MAG: hypothetical protein K6U74_20170 [Firmicutes bacterium]|nr:hypothetical protein [Bacillota bacterium]
MDQRIMTGIYMTGHRLFIDTAAFIAMAWSKDKNHERAVNFISRVNNAVIQITTSFIVSEIYTFLRYKVNYYTAMRFLESIIKADNADYLQIVYSSREIERKAYKILKE